MQNYSLPPFYNSSIGEVISSQSLSELIYDDEFFQIYSLKDDTTRPDPVELTNMTTWGSEENIILGGRKAFMSSKKRILAARYKRISGSVSCVEQVQSLYSFERGVQSRTSLSKTVPPYLAWNNFIVGCHRSWMPTNSMCFTRAIAFCTIVSDGVPAKQDLPMSMLVWHPMYLAVS